MKTEPGFEPTKCPIPNTHQRLRQAHMLWHQADRLYQEPEQFLTNLNSLIQELRNVTFILQSERSLFHDFDGWYHPHQAKLKSNKSAKWLIDTRNLVVKQGALQGSSIGIVKLLTSAEREVVRIPFGDELTAQSILESKQFQDLLPKLRMKVHPGEDAVLIVQPCWSTAELSGREILDVLAEVYGILAEIVLSAHLNIGKSNCIPIYDELQKNIHRDFPLLYDRSGLLRCMIMHLAERSAFFRLSSLVEMIPRKAIHDLKIERWALLDRYGSDVPEEAKAFETLDPLAMVGKIVYTSKKMLRKDKNLTRIVWLRDSQGRWSQTTIFAETRAEKHLFMREMANVVREIGCDAFIEVGEVWTATLDEARMWHSPSLEDYPGHGEAVLVQLATRDGLERSYKTPFKRGPAGGIKLEETNESDQSQTDHIAPIKRVWMEHKKVTDARAGGNPVWNPDDLDQCPCGADSAFGVCCKQHIDKLHLADQSEVMILLTSGKPAEAELLARARVARYAIWVRQHTARSLNADREFAKLITPTDALALECELDLLNTCISASGQSELMLFTYHRLTQILGVPALARRMVSLSAKWLIRHNRIEEGLLELATLGDLNKCNEWLALTLAAEFGEYSPQEETKLLELAFAAALGPEEKSLALKHIVAHHFVIKQWPEALSAIERSLSVDDHEGDLTNFLKVMKWRIEQREEDFESIFEKMTSSEKDDEKMQYAAWLIETDHPAEALALITPLLRKEITMAILIASECHFILSDNRSASALFNKIDRSKLDTQALLLGFAHVQALLVIKANRIDLLDQAIRDLETAIQTEKKPSVATVSTLRALKDLRS